MTLHPFQGCVLPFWLLGANRHKTSYIRTFGYYVLTMVSNE